VKVIDRADDPAIAECGTSVRKNIGVAVLGIEGAVAMRDHFQFKLAGFKTGSTETFKHCRQSFSRARLQLAFQVPQLLESHRSAQRQIDSLVLSSPNARYAETVAVSLRIIEKPRAHLWPEPIRNAPVGRRLGKNRFAHESAQA